MQDDICAGGYPLPMHPVDFSHFLFVVLLGDKWRWSYLPKEQLWRHPPDKPAIFNTSVATVGGVESDQWMTAYSLKTVDMLTPLRCDWIAASCNRTNSCRAVWQQHQSSLRTYAMITLFG
eukprot:GHUV01051892.1.p2 GENE.GHUV01051892.1~~GHUV01051892.1.p2  ORF type:complete len:120 (+),score=24.99 GHUV01051892.1:56-415(+)